MLEILDGTPRARDEIIGLMPPNRVDWTIEKIAIIAVMAGCLPEHMPVVTAVVEAALMPMESPAFHRQPFSEFLRGGARPTVKSARE